MGELHTKQGKRAQNNLAIWNVMDYDERSSDPGGAVFGILQREEI